MTKRAAAGRSWLTGMLTSMWRIDSARLSFFYLKSSLYTAADWRQDAVSHVLRIRGLIGQVSSCTTHMHMHCYGYCTVGSPSSLVNQHTRSLYTALSNCVDYRDHVLVMDTCRRIQMLTSANFQTNFRSCSRLCRGRRGISLRTSPHAFRLLLSTISTV